MDVLVHPLHSHAPERVIAGTVRVWNGPSAIGAARSGNRALRDTCRVGEQTRHSCRTRVTSGRAKWRNSRADPRGWTHSAASRERRVAVLPRHRRAAGVERAGRTGGQNGVLGHGPGPTPIRLSQLPGDSAPLPALHGRRSTRDAPRRDDGDAVLHGVPARMGRTSVGGRSRGEDGSPGTRTRRPRRSPHRRSFGASDLHVLCD